MRCCLKIVSAGSAFLAVTVASCAPVTAANFIPGVLSLPQTSPRPDGTMELQSASLADPASIQANSSSLSFEYNAENLLRTKEGSRLTSDLQSWGDSESLFMPLRIWDRPTTLALSRTSSSASLFHADDETGAKFDWGSESRQWGLSHSIGKTRIGIAGSSSSATAPGESLYPSQACRIFTGWTPVEFRLSGRETMVQVVRPIAKLTELSVRLGSNVTRLQTNIGQGSSLLSVPVSTNSAVCGFDLSRQLRDTTSATIGFSHSRARSSTSLYRAGDPIGKLRYGPGYRQLSLSLRYQRRPDTVWDAGFVVSRWNLGLQGISIDGDELGLNLKPFSERIDFRSNTDLTANIAHVGMRRQMSDKWSWGWRYKLARVKSTIDADYFGRAFFGLISISGAYDNTFVAARVHGLELSARYARKSTSVEIVLAQIIPQSSSSNDTPEPATRSKSATHEDSKSTGGTSLSVVASYAL